MPKGIPKNGINKGWFKNGHSRKHTEEEKRKIGLANSVALKGRKETKEHRENISKGTKEKHQKENNPSWKGDNAKYAAMHNFARRHFGKPQYCEMCGTNEDRMYHWAAKDRLKGGRNRTDWLRLCVPCHKKYDK